MSLAFLAYRNMMSKPLNLLLSLLLLVLSVSLVTFVLQLSKQLSGQIDRNIAPFDMVVGAKGSPLQLVLSSVLHVDVPTGNIPLKEATSLSKNPLVGATVPVSYGDNFKGYRILGTTHEYLDKYEAILAEGELFAKSFEVVLGSSVAKESGLKIGETFASSHGLAASGGEAHEDHPFKVTGILEPTGLVVDRLIITNLESVWEAHEHGEETHDDGDEDREITSLLVKFRNPLAMVQLPRFINENTSMQAALPSFEIQRLMSLLGSGIKTINGIAFAILLVSGLSIFISLLKTIRERRQELALLRTYGLGTSQLLWIVFLEALFLTLAGFLLGWLLGRMGIALASYFTQASYGHSLQLYGPTLTELILLGMVLVISIIATILASLSIFKLNISKTLSNA